MNKVAVNTEMLELAQDVLFIIFSHLSVIEVMRLREVCKGLAQHVADYQSTCPSSVKIIDVDIIEQVLARFPKADIHVSINEDRAMNAPLQRGIKPYIELPNSCKLIQRLRLRDLDCHISDLTQLHQLKLLVVRGNINLLGFRRLEHLTLQKVNFNSPYPDSTQDLLSDTVLDTLVSLKYLRVAYMNYIGDLSKLVNLTTLILISVKTSADLSKLTRLQHLYMDNTDNMSNISNLTNLRTLEMHREINVLDLSCLRQLRVLIVYHSYNSSVICGLTKLRHLTLCSTNIVVKLEDSPNVDAISLTNVNISINLNRLLKLDYLYLYRCKYSHDLSELRELVALKLSKTDCIGDLSKLPQLKQLTLSESVIEFDLANYVT